jgi:hypothetical protein
MWHSPSAPVWIGCLICLVPVVILALPELVFFFFVVMFFSSCFFLFLGVRFRV